MASAIEDVSSLPGETVNDQDGRKIGEVQEIYAVGDDETPMWVTIESSTGIGVSRIVFVPLARLKKEADEIRVPYSFQHVHDAPEVESEDELSEEDDRALRDYYAIGLADQEMVSNAQSYASQVPDEEEPARRVEANSVEGPVREIEETEGEKERGGDGSESGEQEGDGEHEPGGEGEEEPKGDGGGKDESEDGAAGDSG